jgi:hypothetical protein
MTQKIARGETIMSAAGLPIISDGLSVIAHHPILDERSPLALQRIVGQSREPAIAA